MEGIWEVICRGQVVGKCTVTREGLYYRFHCRCRVHFDKMCCLNVKCGENVEKLGVLVPVEGGFGLDTRLAAKRFAQGVPEFAAVPRKNPDEEVSDRHFIPIKPEEPFAYLSRLENAYFVCRNGEIGVILK